MIRVKKGKKLSKKQGTDGKVEKRFRRTQRRNFIVHENDKSNESEPVEADDFNNGNNEMDLDIPTEGDFNNIDESNHDDEQCVENQNGDQNVPTQNNGEASGDIWKIVESLANEVRALREKVKTPKVSGPPRISNPPFVLEKTTNFDTWRGILQNEIKRMKLDGFLSENIDVNDNATNESIGYVNAYILARINEDYKQSVAELNTPPNVRTFEINCASNCSIRSLLHQTKMAID